MSADPVDRALQSFGFIEPDVPPLVRPGEGLDRLVELHRRARDGGLFTFGMPALDAQLAGGLAPGELCLVVGYAGAGKTKFVMSSIVNQDLPVLWITPDETASMVTRDMISMLTGMTNGEIATAIELDDVSTIDMIREVAEALAERVLIVDETVGRDDLGPLTAAATEHWGRSPGVLVFDYLQLMPHHPDHRGTLARQFKGWAKTQPFPTLLIHQSSRHAGIKGQAMEMWSGSQEGEQEAIIMIGVSRPADDPDSHADPFTVMVRLLKNKHTGRKVTVYATQDPLTGRISE